jgi:phosphoribosylcarboxyaminoimidazole (NCAIR) mutase
MGIGTKKRPRVGVVMGSESDRPTMEEAERVLTDHGGPASVVRRPIARPRRRPTGRAPRARAASR